MKKIVIVAFAVFSILGNVRAGAVITSFTATKAGDSLNFNWVASSENNMFYYEVMEVINVNGSEKMLVHVNAAGTDQTSGQTYNVNVALSRALMVGFSGMLLLLLAGAVLGWSKTFRKLAVLSICVLFINLSCKKHQSQPNPVLGNPDVPGNSSSTQGVFRLKSVDQDGNISYTGYIVLTY